jgi:hypothetical protein
VGGSYLVNEPKHGGEDAIGVREVEMNDWKLGSGSLSLVARSAGCRLVDDDLVRRREVRYDGHDSVAAQ